MGIATEMGLILRNTSHSVNIKERLDFSCAIFDGKGDLVSNAPHQPVHLGSMADTVKNHMRYIQENAVYSVKQALSKFIEKNDPLETTFEDYLDNGTPLRVKIIINGGKNPPETVRALIDFTGTGLQHNNGNLNTPASVTRSAILYVLRTLTDNAYSH